MKTLKMLIPVRLTLCLLLSFAVVPSAADDEAEPDYQFREISTAEELLSLSDDDNYDGNFILTADIALTGEYAVSPIEFFEGCLDGNGHKITGYKGNAALIDTLGNGGLIKNLVIEDATVTAPSMVAMLVQTNVGTLWNLTFRNINVTVETTDAAGVCYENMEKGRIEHIDFEGVVTGNGDRAAGIVIHQRKGAVLRYCISRGTVQSNFHVGGISSQLEDGAEIESCLNFATVIAKNSRAGGISATNQKNSKIINCGNYGEVRAWRNGDAQNSDAKVAGIGANETSGFEFRNCFNAGRLVTKKTSVFIGGICSYSNMTGDDFAAAFVNCYTVSGTMNRYTDEAYLTTEPIDDAGLSAKATSCTIVTAEEFGSQAMIEKLGDGFVLTEDPAAPIGLAADTTPEPMPRVPEPKPTETEPESKPEPTPTTAPDTDEEKPSDTEPQTTAPAKEEKGCASVLGFSSIMMIAAAGVLVGAFRKKEDCPPPDVKTTIRSDFSCGWLECCCFYSIN